MKPSPPIARGGPAPQVRAFYKQIPEDFSVTELPLYQPCGEGDHCYLYVEKRGLSTMLAVESLAAEFGRDPREFGYAGLKDAQAVTRQWISLEHIEAERVKGLELPGLRVLEALMHGNKLRMGHLRGNRFAIVLRGCEPSDLESIQQNLAHMEAVGVPNYFGEQRFGKRGANLAKGLKILRGNPRKAARRIPKRLLRLLISAVQSEAFNRVLMRRLDHLHQLENGDVAWIHDSGACFMVDDAAVEQERCSRFEISPSGPMPGPKMLRAGGEIGALEDAVLAEMEIDCEIFAGVPHGTNSGVRRSLRTKIGSPNARLTDSGILLEFDLGKGSFATAVLGELIDCPPGG